MKKFAILVALALVASLLVFYGGQTATADHPAGPAAYWSLDEGSGTTATDAAHSNDGTISGATYTGGGADAAPVPGNVDALHFASSGDLVRVLDDTLLRPAEVTVSAWVRNDGAPTSYDYILAKTLDGGKASYALYTGGSRGLFFYASGATYHLSDDAGTGIWDGSWHHIAGTYDGSLVRLFVDGSEIGTANTGPLAIAYGTTVFNGDLSIGSYSNLFSPLADWRGDIDEVQIYDRALSSDEIAILAGTSDQLFVDDDGQVGFGSIDCDGVGIGAYTVIQDAVDAASPGDTINVCPRIYSEDVDINTDDLTLTGDPGDGAAGPAVSHPILDGTGLGDTSGFYIGLDVSGVTIKGFEIRGYTNPGRYDEVCTIATGGIGSAIIAWNKRTSDITIQDNYLHDLGWNGVLVGSDDGTVQTGWLVQRNKVKDVLYAGIELTNVVDSQVLDNVITARTDPCVRDPGDSGVGIEIATRTQSGGTVSSGTGVLVEGNVITGAPFERAGINILSRAYLSSSVATLTGVTVRNNLVADGAERGIYVVAESRNNGDAMIDDLLIKSNTLDNNVNGIVLNETLLSGSGTPKIEDVTLLGNNAHHGTWDGINVTNGVDADLFRNIAYHNVGTGIANNGDGICSSALGDPLRNKAKFNGVNFVKCP